MAATLSETRILNVQLPDLKSIAHFTTHVAVGSLTFVKLEPYNRSLVKLVLEANSLAPASTDSKISLTCCKGLQDLVICRNNACNVQDDANEDDSERCNIFGEETEVEAKPKKMKRKREDVESMRTNPSIVTIEVEFEDGMHKIKVLSAGHARDQLFVEYEVDTLARVIRHMRVKGFNEIVKIEKEILPPGVYKRSDGYVVKYRNDEGKDAYKRFSTADAALSFHDSPTDDSQQVQLEL